MEKVLARREEIAPAVRRRRDFGMVDAKGRQIGGGVRIERFRYVPAPAEAKWGYRIDAADMGVELWKAEPHAYRDGKPFGALQNGKICRDEAAVEAYVDAYFAGAQKRAAKIAAKK